MNRSEHLQWCKDRANAYVDSSDIQQAFASMVSDMNKHEETKGPCLVELGMMYAVNNDAEAMRRWINGYN